MESTGLGRVRRVAPRLAGWCVLALLGLNLLALAGFVVRDRSVLWALLFYLPLLPLGLAAFCLDLGCRGRSLQRPRFGLAAVGLAAMGISCLTMIGLGPERPSSTGTIPEQTVRLLHWNVLWGGWPRSDSSWSSIEDSILHQQPDVVVLSEAPTPARLASLQRRLGAGWSSARIEHDPRNAYWFKLVVLSRWPVPKASPVPIRNGTAVDLRVERPGRLLRLLVVDGQSKVTQLRAPMLHDIAEVCRSADEAGAPFDILAGDFNTVSRSLGFGALESAAGGYALATRVATGWRGTWPMPLPVYDIDHVLVHGKIRIRSCALFTNVASDHRGQIVTLALPCLDPLSPDARRR